MSQGTAPHAGFQMPDGSWLLGVAGGQNQLVKPNLTAATTQTQAKGTALAYGLNALKSVANANDAVTMPQAKAGTMVILANNGGNITQLFPHSGDAINDAAKDAAVTVADNTLSLYVCLVDGQWFGGAITFEA